MPEGDGGEAGDGSEAGAEAESGSKTAVAAVAEAAVNFVATYGAARSRALSKQGGGLSRHGSRSKFSGRSTICVSSQVGCAVDCQFCLTALLGVKRNLTAGEIVGQVCAVLKDQGVSPPEDRINLVFMGMGEPFLNYENFVKAGRLLVEGVGIAERRMTVSTAGIVPRIRDFGEEIASFGRILSSPKSRMRGTIPAVDTVILRSAIPTPSTSNRAAFTKFS